MIGVILGSRYELIEKIGEGGMAEVYKARCNKLNRYVAVKILKKEFCDNEDIVNKFKREATAIAGLSDTNIVNVLDVGTQDGINYIVMEYVKGKTLKEFIKQFGKLNYESAITIGIQIAKALECAHKNGIIHRDVKPQNILITEEGVIKVTDFGIAKSSSSATLTNTTTIMGSAHYFSPEQAKGSIVDNRADLYSLGVVLYEMVTGKLPFEADSPVTIALKHIQDEVVPPKSINSKIPENLSKLIMKCMEKDPALRYQSAREIITDLQKIKEDPNVVIDENPKEENDRTIVMAPVKEEADLTKKVEPIKNDLEEDYYDEDYDDEDYEDDEDDEEEERRGKKPLNKPLIIGIVSAVLLLLLGVGAFFLFSGGKDNTNDEVKVPTLIGLTEEEAKTKIESLGLVYVLGGTTEPENNEEEGTVVEVYPKEGSEVKKGSEVRVIISSGAEKIKMPNLADATKENAIRILNASGFDEKNYDFQYENSDSIKAGIVTRTNPEAKTEITKDTKITIYISDGPKIKYTKMPNIIGLTRDQAIAALTKSGLGYDPQEKEVEDESQVGVVVGASREIGESVEEGRTITFYVGKKAAKEMVDLRVIKNDMTLAEVKEKVGGKVEIIAEGDVNGVVSNFNGVNGSYLVEKGSSVTITFISKPSESGTGTDGNDGNQGGSNQGTDTPEEIKQ